MKKYLLILSAIVFSLVIVFMFKTIIFARSPSLEIFCNPQPYAPACTGKNSTSWPTVSSVLATPEVNSVIITAYIVDVSGVYARADIYDIADQLNPVFVTSVVMHDDGSFPEPYTSNTQPDGWYGVAIDTTGWNTSDTYSIDISTTDNLGINSGTTYDGVKTFSLPGPASPDKAITAFDFNDLSITGVITESSHTIALTVPYGTDVAALVPTITITGASVSPASGVANDFTSPATYTVAAADGSTQDYVVTVTVAPRTATTLSLSASPSTVAIGSSTTFTATLSPAIAAKQITVTEGTDYNSSCTTNSSGQCTATPSFTIPTTISASPPPLAVSASFAGDSAYLGSTITTNLTITDTRVTPYFINLSGLTGDIGYAHTFAGYLIANCPPATDCSGFTTKGVNPGTVSLYNNTAGIGGWTADTDTAGMFSFQVYNDWFDYINCTYYDIGKTPRSYTVSFGGDTTYQPAHLDFTNTCNLPTCTDCVTANSPYSHTDYTLCVARSFSHSNYTGVPWNFPRGVCTSSF